jgi:hypothetical protein
MPMNGAAGDIAPVADECPRIPALKKQCPWMGICTPMLFCLAWTVGWVQIQTEGICGFRGILEIKLFIYLSKFTFPTKMAIHLLTMIIAMSIKKLILNFNGNNYCERLKFYC